MRVRVSKSVDLLREVVQTVEEALELPVDLQVELRPLRVVSSTESAS